MTLRSKAASVEFRRVSKAFGPVVAVREVSFTIEAGTLVTLLGPSGCGKTTTLRLIAGLEMATAGQILIGGTDVTRLPATDRDVSMVFQSYALFPHMTVLENVCYGLSVSGQPRAQAEAAAREGLALLGLAGFDARLPSELSGGQQQRVAVARALVLEPQVLLFDEPLSNLDAKLRRRVREEIRELQQKLGLTVAYVTHDQEEALAVSDQIIVMENAAIAQQGSPEALYGAPASRFVADFIGDANLVAGTLRRSDGERGTVSLAGLTVSLPHRGLPDGPVTVAIRPESVRLGSGVEGGPGVAGTVVKAAYLGSHMEYTVSSPIGELFVVDPAVGARLTPGTPVAIGLADHGVTVVH
ncbi:MAG TPA: ABC transporter ATP-binding protein [Methylomirabilota bacterium]|nr:ABC transporter ATP-binding protein [Methylomirabilota bacterium]